MICQKALGQNDGDNPFAFQPVGSATPFVKKVHQLMKRNLRTWNKKTENDSIA